MPLGGRMGGIIHNATFNSKRISHRKFSDVILELPHGMKSM